MANIREYYDKSGKLVSFYIKVYRGRDSSGKQLKPYTTTFKVDPDLTYKRAKKEAEKFALIFEEQCRQGKISTSAISLFDYMNYTIELKYKRNQLKNRTYTLYKNIALKISEEIGFIKLKDLRVSDLNNYYTKLSKSLSAKTVIEYHHLISSTLKQAVKEGLLVSNIANNAEIPKLSKSEPKYFQITDIKKILDAANNENLKHKLLIYLFVFTGARRGEILGLKWDCIDFESNSIYIKNSILYTKEHRVFEDTPKTIKSIRKIQIPQELTDLLIEYKNQSNYDLLFCNKLGKPLHPDSVNTYLSRFSKKYNLIHINSHAFRHTMASLLYSEGMDSVSISARLGHSKVSTTANIYSHVMNNYDLKNSEILSKVYKNSDNVEK